MYLQGPWAIGEIATANPKLKVPTFALPATDDPADTKVRVNLDLPSGSRRPRPSEPRRSRFLTYLMQPSVMYKYNTQNLAFSPVKNPPPVQGRRGSPASSRTSQPASSTRAPGPTSRT